MHFMFYDILETYGAISVTHHKSYSNKKANQNESRKILKLTVFSKCYHSHAAMIMSDQCMVAMFPCLSIFCRPLLSASRGLFGGDEEKESF